MDVFMFLKLTAQTPCDVSRQVPSFLQRRRRVWVDEVTGFSAVLSSCFQYLKDTGAVPQS